ncbi:MAG: nuclear transport factor 2 family protein [Nocardioides sp.]
MTLTRAAVLEVVDVYIKAWTQQDPDLILSIFTESATYHERVLEEPIRDHAGIRSYWISKVVETQDNISCTVLNVYLEGATAIVEWDAEFDDLIKGCRKQMREVAILTFEGGKIASLREYWASRRVGDLP